VLSGTSASIAWATDQIASSQGSLSHAVTLTGLTCATTYHYLVSSTDSSIHTTISADGTFTTLRCSSPGKG
jgi:hypothetical protein